MAFALPMAVSLGVSLLSSLLFPAPDVTNEGARVTDLKATGSDYGVSIPRVWGRARVGGNLMWAREVTEVRTAEQQGGKGGPTVTNITYSYFGTFAVLLCHGPVVDVRRIWMNGELVYNTEPGASAESVANSNEWRSKYVRFYPGSITQNPDDLIQATQGSNRTPAWRGFCYLVFDGLPLEDYGNRLPAIEVEVVERNAGGEGPFVIIADIVEDICLDAGLTLSQIDTTELSCLTIDGFATNQVQEARAPIEELQIFHQFSIVEADGKLFFRQEKQQYAEAISRADLGCWEWGNDAPALFEETILDYVDLPTEFRIEFVDGDTNHRSYEIYERMVNEDTIANRNVTQFRTQIVSDISEARSKARILLETAQLRGRKCEFVLPIHYLRIDPGKVIWIELYPGTASSLLIIKKEIGVNGLIKYEAISYGGIQAVVPDQDDFTYAAQPSYVTLDNAAYEATPPSTLAPPYNPTTGTVTIPGTTDLRVYDVPLIGDSHPSDCGVYLGAAGGADNIAWKGALVYVSRNAGVSWAFVSRLTGTSIFGICNTILATGPTGVADNTNTISVTLQSPGSLSSVTNDDFLRGAQIALIGNELVWFKNATLTAPRTYTLDTLFRGRRGTEWAVGGHIADERFALMTGYGERIELATADLGTTLQFKALTSGTAQDFDDVPTISLPFSGISQECYSPVNLAATKDNAGNISLVWDRRDRRAGDRTDYANFPLSEVSERYETEIRNVADTATLRTIDSTTPLVRYTAAQQVTDFGSVQSTIKVRVYQLSALLGRGYVGAATLTPSLVAAVPVITDFAPRAGAIGDTVRVYGTGFTGATALTINGTAVTGPTVVSDTEVTGVVAAGTTTGAIVLTAPGGVASSPVAFIIVTASGDLEFFNEGVSQGTAAELDVVGSLANLLISSGRATLTILPARELLTIDRTYFVSTTGSNSNNGLTAGSPFLTIQKAVDVVATLDLGIYNTTIQVANGTYSESVLLKRTVGSGNVIIQGNLATPTNVIISAPGGSAIACAVPGYTVQGISVTGSIGMLVSSGGNMQFSQCSFAAATDRQVAVVENGRLEITGGYSIGGGAAGHLFAGNGGIIRTVGRAATISGSINYSFAFAWCAGGEIICNGSTYTGGTVTGKRYDSRRRGIISFTGGNANFFPGSAAGTPVPAATEAQVHAAEYGLYY